MKSSEQRTCVIFGQGPVLRRSSRLKAQDDYAAIGEEDQNFWGHSLGYGGSVLWHRGVSSGYVVLGGPTGGVSPSGIKYLAEADLIRGGLMTYGVPPEVIKLEKESTNTLENMTNFIDLYLGADPEMEVDFLGAVYHISRIKLLAFLFNIRFRFVFASHELVRVLEYEGNFATSPVLTRLERMLDLNTIRRTEGMMLGGTAIRHFYQNLLGAEARSYWERFMEEDAFTRMLLEVPSYWMLYPARIKSDPLFAGVLRNIEFVFPGYLQTEGIDPTLTDPASLQRARSKLAEIKRPDIAGWIREVWPLGWPQETRDKLNRIVEMQWRYETAA